MQTWVNLWLYPWLSIELTHVVVNNNFASVERYRCKTLLSEPSKSQNWTAGRSFENEIQYYSFLEIRAYHLPINRSGWIVLVEFSLRLDWSAQTVMIKRKRPSSVYSIRRLW